MVNTAIPVISAILAEEEQECVGVGEVGSGVQVPSRSALTFDPSLWWGCTVRLLWFAPTNTQSRASKCLKTRFAFPRQLRLPIKSVPMEGVSFTGLWLDSDGWSGRGFAMTQWLMSEWSDWLGPVEGTNARLEARQRLACALLWPDDSAWMLGFERKSRGGAKRVPLSCIIVLFMPVHCSRCSAKYFFQ